MARSEIVDLATGAVLGGAVVGSYVLWFRPRTEWVVAGLVVNSLVLLVGLLVEASPRLRYFLPALLLGAFGVVPSHIDGMMQVAVVVLLVNAVYLVKFWEHLGARLVGFFGFPLVLFAIHPPIVSSSPADYGVRTSRLAEFAPSPVEQALQAMISGYPGTLAKYGWIALGLLAFFWPFLILMDLMRRILLGWRDRIRAEEATGS